MKAFPLSTGRREIASNWGDVLAIILSLAEGQFEHLYGRSGNSTRLLTTKETIEYCKNRWRPV